MAPVQNSYEITHEAALPGMAGNMGPQSVVSRVSSGAIPFGRAVVRMADQTAQLANATSQAYLGVSKRDVSRNLPVGASAQYESAEEVAIMEDGYAWVEVEEAVSRGDAVYFRHDGAGVLGAFRNDGGGGNATLVAGATFETDATAGQAALIRMPYGT
jgi:hypothetical protein